ncbi:MAG: putative DNA-binding domain-containing protein [Pseudomonadota bacterium]
MLDFQHYQLAFTAHIRNPTLHPKPAKVVGTRMAVYREAVFNNIFESVSVCFPVCQNVLGKRKWRQLLRDFVANYAADSPLFREIPQQFLAFLETLNVEDLPPYIKPLAHYEWIELAVSSKPLNQQLTQTIDGDLNSLDCVITLAPSGELLTYDYPVHKISPRFKPASIEKTYLFVFRNTSLDVKFIVLNPITFELLSLIQAQQLTGKMSLTRLATALQHPDIHLFMHFGTEILNDLRKQEAILFSPCTRSI